jgi:hypothetical protein
MKKSHKLWEILVDETVLKPYTSKFFMADQIKSAILFKTSSDNEDGTYPRVCDYTRFANKLYSDGASFWINSLTKKKNKLNIEFCGCKIIRSADYYTDAILEFPKIIPVFLGYNEEEPIFKQVKKIRGEFKHDWFWTLNPRQEKKTNGFEIWFNIKEFL